MLPLIAPHFADRLYQENWIIHDLRRGQPPSTGGGGWFLTEAEALSTLEKEGRSGAEQEFQKLWQAFAAALPSRNGAIPAARTRDLVSLRFRPYMTEFGADRSRTVLN